MDSISTIDTFNNLVRNKYSRLSPEHQKHIAERGLLDNNWTEMTCYTTSAKNATSVLGYPAKSGGIMFWGYNNQYQFRPDTPWESEDGECPKYRTPMGGYDALLLRHLTDDRYWEPDYLKEACWKVNGRPCLVLTEGGFKAIAGCSNGIPTIALLGVEMELTGARHDPDNKRYLVPSIKKYAEAGLGFIITFDADAASNPDIHRAEKTLALALKEYNVPVYTVTGHWNVEDGKGMDDFIQNKGIEAFRAILMKAQPVNTESRDTGDITTRKLPTPQAITARLAEEFGHHLKYDEEQQTWRKWSGKHWEKIGLGAFKSWLKNTLDGKGVNYGVSAYLEDVRKLLECDLRQLKWQFWDKSRYINFNNCVFDGIEGKPLEHSPGMGFTSFLPYEFKALAGSVVDPLEALRVNCPKTHHFFRTAMPGDERKMFKLLAIVNAVLKYRFFDLQMFVHLVGAPGSGKGKYSRWIQKMVGSDNTIAGQLEKLSDSSTKASCIDKQVVVFPDERKPVGIDSILSLTGGDAISYRELYKPAASAHFYGGLLICSNKAIFIGDITGLERRLCLVGFDNPIATEKRDHSLEAELDSEIPACIAIALSLPDIAVTQAIRGVGVNQIIEFKRKEWEMKVEASSTAAFFDMEMVLDPTATSRVGKLYEAYKHFCEESGFSKVSIVKFPKLLADLLTNEKLPFIRHQGAQAYFEGIRLREKSDNQPTHSEALAGFEGVGEGVAGSSKEVGEGVALPQDKELRELREFGTKSFTGSANDDNFLPDDEESDREIQEIENLPPSTPSTPSNPVPVMIQTPSPTPSQVPSATPSTPSNAATAQSKFRGEKLADEMREAIAKGSREEAREVMGRVAVSAPQVRGFFNKSFTKEEDLNIRLLKYCGLTKGTRVEYVGKDIEQYAGEVLTVEGANTHNELACLRPDGKGFTTWLKSEDLRKL